MPPDFTPANADEVSLVERRRKFALELAVHHVERMTKFDRDFDDNAAVLAEAFLAFLIGPPPAEAQSKE